MKLVVISFPIHVDDDFKIGDCKKCPMHTISSYESHYGGYTEQYGCSMRFHKSMCPIQEEEEEE